MICDEVGFCTWVAERWARNRYCFGEIAGDGLGPGTMQEVENVDLFVGLDFCGGIDSGEAGER